MIVRENDTVVLVEGKQFKYYLNKRTGLFSKLIFDGKDQLMQPMEANIWGEPTCNDIYAKLEWYRARYDKTSVCAYNTLLEKKENTVVIHSSMSLASDAVQRILDIQTVWTIDAEGIIFLDMHVKRCPEFPTLPKFGIRMHLAKDQNLVNCSGIGSNGCGPELAEQYGLDRKEFEFTMKLVPYTKGEQVWKKRNI